MNRLKLSLILALVFLFCTLGILGAFHPVTRANPALIFSDGFESGNFSAWTSQFTDPLDTIEVIAGAAHSGSYGLHTINNGLADVAITKKVFAQSYTTVYERVYVYMLNIPAQADGYIRFFDLRHGSTQDFGCGLLRDGSNNYEWFIHYPSGGGYANSYSSTFTPSSATWYCLEIKAVVSGTVGEARLYVDGAEVITVTGLNTGTNALDATEVGCGLIDDTPPASNIWFGANYIELHEDDVVVADSYIGETPRYYLYLMLSVDPDQATYARGQSVTFDVSVLNKLSSSVTSTLTLSVTGPGGYGYFDLDRINAKAGISEHSFDWTVPNVAGTYVVEVSLVPLHLTAYDAAWLGVV